MIYNLPDELLVEILWLVPPLVVLTSRLVCKRFKALIDGMAKLQLVIELHRNDRYLVSYSTEEFYSHQETEAAEENELDFSGPSTRIRDILESQKDSRKRWESFRPRLTGKISSGIDDWYCFEFNNGYAAYLAEGNKIIFHDLHHTSDGSVYKTLELPFTCDDFTFDLSQDLLVAIDATNSRHHIHILKASTGLPHSSATQAVINDTPAAIMHMDGSPEGSEEISINGPSVIVFYSSADHLFQRVMIYDWRTGKTIFNKMFREICDAVLISPTLLGVLDLALHPQITLFDIKQNAQEPNPLILLLPQFISENDSVWSYEWAMFLSRPRSRGGDIHHVCQHLGAKDVLAIEFFLWNGSSIEEDSNFLFISVNHLLKLVSEHPDALESTSTPSLGRESAEGPLQNPMRFYHDWGQKGTRWLKGARHLVVDSSSNGSRFVFVTLSSLLGRSIANVIPPESSLASEDTSVSSTSGLICLVEFNERLWDRHKPTSNIVLENRRIGGTLAGLSVDAREEMPFRTTVFIHGIPEDLKRVMVDQDRMILVTERKTQIFTV